MKKIICLMLLIFLLSVVPFNAFAKDVYCKVEYSYNGTNNMKITLVSSSGKVYYIKGFVRENDKQIKVFYSAQKSSQGESNVLVVPQSMFLVPIRIIISDVNGSLPFSDINNSPYKEYILHLASMGKIGGYKDGTFKPKNPITRQEFVKLVVNTFDIQKKSYKKYSFSDINNCWAKDEIETLYGLGFINGFKDKSGKVYFKPNDKVTCEQVIAIVCRILKLRSTAQVQNYNSWANEYINAAVSNNIISQKDIKDIKLSSYATREWVSYILSNALIR